MGNSYLHLLQALVPLAAVVYCLPPRARALKPCRPSPFRLPLRRSHHTTATPQSSPRRRAAMWVACWASAPWR